MFPYSICAFFHNDLQLPCILDRWLILTYLAHHVSVHSRIWKELIFTSNKRECRTRNIERNEKTVAKMETWNVEELRSNSIQNFAQASSFDTRLICEFFSRSFTVFLSVIDSIASHFRSPRVRESLTISARFDCKRGKRWRVILR